ncbi:MAG: hypothetical protein FD161_4170 [Limisphaerales bacterium]|nr:MAG: hypothetical protein FD161_4170 [Limisphaerales bacterium]KAG0507148.1 MAG: hypothetical protein E1N63_3703 [Limisphaerales bacterium]TXT47565.1 MAG: hypothetical protein FD140_4207 [Limisphaerales bacterium]
MQKVLFTLFVGLGYALRSFKHPATWAFIVLVALGLWWKNRSTEAAKVVNQLPPIEFKPLTAAAPETAPSAAVQAVQPDGANIDLAAAIAGGVTDPEQLPVMSSRDLEVAVGRFHKDNLRLPNDADELIEKKYLVGVPPAPPGKRYVLDLSPIKMRLVRK